MQSDSFGTTWLSKTRLAIAGGAIAALAIVGGIAAASPQTEAADTGTTDAAAAAWSAHTAVQYTNATWS